MSVELHLGLYNDDLRNLNNRRVSRRRIYEYIRDRFTHERNGEPVWWNQALANFRPRDETIIQWGLGYRARAVTLPGTTNTIRRMIRNYIDHREEFDLNRDVGNLTAEDNHHPLRLESHDDSEVEFEYPMDDGSHTDSSSPLASNGDDQNIRPADEVIEQADEMMEPA